jgi:hypothetical protein
MSSRGMYLMAEYDSETKRLRVKAQDGFGGPTYSAGCVCDDRAAAESRVRAFADLYGATEIEINGRAVRL